ncbi:hypothetical protein SNL152K_7187 [Streptomyces sp. NL15-2K]|nr:hypothetical protein SNL152K_7187 [Streptomyces sp. NL15-2K]
MPLPAREPGSTGHPGWLGSVDLDGAAHRPVAGGREPFTIRPGQSGSPRWWFTVGVPPRPLRHWGRVSAGIAPASPRTGVMTTRLLYSPVRKGLRAACVCGYVRVMS